MQIYLANDTLLVLDGLLNAVSGNYANSATVVAQVKTSDGVDVGSPITLAYVTASSGKYEGLLDDTVITARGRYVVVIDADAGGGLNAHWEIPATALVRRS